MLTKVRNVLRRAAAVARQVLGVPDYDRYVEHLRARHPQIEPPARADFYRSRLEARYDKPGARCC
jgi:uncharacterized short protein YbdD (DUF466 family)